MVRPCDSAITCPPDSGPGINFSSEAPDAICFPALGWDNTPVPIAMRLRDTNPAGYCCSTISAQDALQCARLAAFKQKFSSVVSGTPPALYNSTQQSATATCPDGSSFTYTVPAGKFQALTQASADMQAQQWAQQQANLLLICMGVLSATDIGAGTFSSLQIIVTGGVGGNTVSIVSGALPAGMSVAVDPSGVFISGTPTVPGDYSFSLRVTDSQGDYMVKSYTLTVLGLTNGAPPEAILNQAYSFQFTATGGVGSYTFALASGSLPPGLSLSAAGLLYGTPTASADYSFAVSVTDQQAVHSQSSYTLRVGSIFDNMVWDTVTKQDQDNAVTKWSAVKSQILYSATTVGDSNAVVNLYLHGSMSINPSAPITCHMKFPTDSWNGPTTPNFGIRIESNGNLLTQTNSPPAPGASFDFNIGAGQQTIAVFGTESAGNQLVNYQPKAAGSGNWSFEIDLSND